MTDQEMFDYVVSFMREQADPAATPNEGCRYRLPKEGGGVLKCSVGCLIPDDVYNIRLENFLPNDRDDSGVYIILHLIEEAHGQVSLGLLNDLRIAHDASAADLPDPNAKGGLKVHRGKDFLAEFESRAQEVALNHKLAYTPPGE